MSNQLETCSECGGCGLLYVTQCCNTDVKNTKHEKTGRCPICNEYFEPEICENCENSGLMEIPTYIDTDDDRKRVGRIVEWEFDSIDYEFECALYKERGPTGKIGLYLYITRYSNNIPIIIGKFKISKDPNLPLHQGTEIDYLKGSFRSLGVKFEGIEAAKTIQAVVDLCMVLDLTKVPIIGEDISNVSGN